MKGSLTSHLSLSGVHCHQTDEMYGEGSISTAPLILSSLSDLFHLGSIDFLSVK